jgi:tetratricopeptide (TPR) repeat protein
MKSAEASQPHPWRLFTRTRSGVDEQFAGNFQEAFDSFQKATQLDPNFARAYTGMAAMAQNLGKPADAVKYMKLAMEHIDRMTDRERYRDRGLYYLTTGDWQNCVRNTRSSSLAIQPIASARTILPVAIRSCATRRRRWKRRNMQCRLFPRALARG